MKDFLDEMRKVFDKSEPLKERLSIGLATLITAVILIALAVLVWKAVPMIMATLALLYLLFGNQIEAAAERKRATLAEQQNAALVESQIAWREMAVRAVGPVLSRVFGFTVHSEEMAFFDEPAWGMGFYFKMPEPVADTGQRLSIRRSLAQRISALVGIPPAQLIRKGQVRVGADCVYIGPDVSVVQGFLTLARGT